MTILPPLSTTAGLKVPADSNPSPCGEMTGFDASRFQDPKGGRGEPKDRQRTVIVPNKAVRVSVVKLKGERRRPQSRKATLQSAPKAASHRRITTDTTQV